jgi:hypothetical protein
VSSWNQVRLVTVSETVLHSIIRLISLLSKLVEQLNRRLRIVSIGHSYLSLLDFILKLLWSQLINKLTFIFWCFYRTTESLLGISYWHLRRITNDELLL